MAFRPPQKNVKLVKIKEYLDKNKITYADLGRATGYSRDYISRLMRRKRPLSEEFVLLFYKFIIQKEEREKKELPNLRDEELNFFKEQYKKLWEKNPQY